MKLFSSPIFRVIFPSLAVLLALRLAFWLITFPNSDEAYYWLWGQHPAFSYYDHPPFHAWIQGLFTNIFGRSNFTLRLPNLISNSLLIYTYYRITRRLYGPNATHAFWLVVILVLSSPLYFLFLALAWHDHWLITLSLISAHLFITFLDGYQQNRQGSSWRLYAAAIALGLAGLCKYIAVFMALGFTATILSDKSLRPLLRDRRLYWAGAIAASTLLPILIWNYANDFQSFQFYFDRSLNSSGANGFHLNPIQPLGFLLLSILIFSPFNSWAIFQVIKRKPQSAFPSLYRKVALWIFALSTGTLTAISLLSTANYYWNILAYPLLFPLAPTVFLRNLEEVGKPEDRSQKSGDWRQKQRETTVSQPASQPKSKIQNPPTHPPIHPSTHPPIHPSTHPPSSRLLLHTQLYGLLIATILVIHYSLLPLSALFSDAGDLDTRMLFGWSQVAAKIEEKSADLRDEPLLFTTDYRSASALAYQLNNPTVMALSSRIDQFDFWYDQNQFQGKTALILGDDWHPICPELLSQFEQTSPLETISVTRFGVWIKNYYLLIGSGFNAGPDDQFPLSKNYPLTYSQDGETCLKK
ncbi:MAG: glycosyltransferase family 39 protein [Leptolyngbyaceae cyanobacterium MO_188.B28]|nr:glycosyltransferase family 39 protein [Leptolyngbyaceae cyanobacterium MO_188.B28]